MSESAETLREKLNATNTALMNKCIEQMRLMNEYNAQLDREIQERAQAPVQTQPQVQADKEMPDEDEYGSDYRTNSPSMSGALPSTPVRGNSSSKARYLPTPQSQPQKKRRYNSPSQADSDADPNAGFQRSAPPSWSHSSSRKPNADNPDADDPYVEDFVVDDPDADADSELDPDAISNAHLGEGSDPEPPNDLSTNVIINGQTYPALIATQDLIHQWNETLKFWTRVNAWQTAIDSEYSKIELWEERLKQATLRGETGIVDDYRASLSESQKRLADQLHPQMDNLIRVMGPLSNALCCTLRHALQTSGHLDTDNDREWRKVLKLSASKDEYAEYINGEIAAGRMGGASGFGNFGPKRPEIGTCPFEEGKEKYVGDRVFDAEDGMWLDVMGTPKDDHHIPEFKPPQERRGRVFRCS